MKPILIIKTGASIPNLVAHKKDFEDWIVRGMQVPRESVSTVNVEVGASLPDANTVSGVVITGSHAMVTAHHAWSERVAAWLPGTIARNIPILGICYGHQVLAYALGGEVDDNPNGREFGTVNVTPRRPAAALAPVPVPPCPFPAHVAHTQSVLQLPAGARVLATTTRDPHAAVAFTPTTWGVQFHPEFDADVIRAYIIAYAAILRAEGQDPDALLASVRDTPEATGILRWFADLVMGCE